MVELGIKAMQECEALRGFCVGLAGVLALEREQVCGRILRTLGIPHQPVGPVVGTRW